jgi:hypothetical protein
MASGPLMKRATTSKELRSTRVVKANSRRMTAVKKEKTKWKRVRKRCPSLKKK